MTESDFIWRFTPSRTDPELLEQIFVQRQELLADLVERVRESATTRNKHQVLLIGPRGIGKTHIITLLHHRLTQDPALSDKLRIAWLLEDETITSFVQLLKRIYELLAEERPGEFPREWLDELLDRSPARILRSLEEKLVDQFQDRTLLLLVENLDQLFEGLGDEGQKQWRAFLQTYPFTTVVATTQRLFKDVQKREQPFFGFFAPEHLRPLPAPDAVDLLRRIAQHRKQDDLLRFLSTPEGRSRVRAIHHLAGGNHRIYIVLSGFITRESLDELAGPFEKMADELTPYYQERMRWLSPQQRQIIEFLCARDQTCTPREIARNLLASENTIGKQLKRLAELGYVTSSPRGRESLYELAEPLMRLATEVKEKRREPLRLLVNFLRAWYRPEVLPQLLERAGTPSLRMHLQAAISQSRSSADPRLKILESEIARAREENRLEDLIEVLEERAHAQGSARDWFELGYYHSQRQNFSEALGCYERALAINPGDAVAWHNKGYALDELGRYEEAIAALDHALEIDPGDADTWNGRGYLYFEAGPYQDALRCYEKTLEIDAQHPFAWNNMGEVLHRLGRHEDARECHEKVLELTGAGPATAFERCKARIHLGHWEAGFEDLRVAFEKYPKDTTHDAQTIIDLIRRQGDNELRRQHLARLIAIYVEADVLGHLGNGLVRSLRWIARDRPDVKTLEEWLTAWLELGAGHAELEMPLRIFRVGVEYLIRNDERILLDLVSVERKILRQALGLEPTGEDASDRLGLPGHAAVD